ncbi:MAG: hypothetical protein V4632_09720 [Pseudomonadota bacterium]
MKNVMIAMMVMLLAGCAGMNGSGYGTSGTDAAGTGAPVTTGTTGMIDEPSAGNQDRDIYHPFVN